MPDPTGFSVLDLAPFRGGRGALRLGLRPLPEAKWRDQGTVLPSRVAAKVPIFDTVPESLIVLPQAAPAVAELSRLVGTDTPDLRAAAMATYEDLLILLPRDGVHVLVAGALAFPTDWHLDRKIGHPLAAIHAPIPTYAEKLSPAVDHVFATLTPERMLLRTNWNVLETDDLRYLPDRPAIDRFDNVTNDNAGDTLYVRVERQTLRRLPRSGAAVFTIGVYIEPLRALTPALVQDLSQAVHSVPQEEAIRRGTPGYRDALAAYADACAVPTEN
ncbi:heme-dependent oxidative N-demethylase family protein [Sphingobium algorifonticola]|uniref:DUF3445 domain-containing protein n=1 Tax=Sphingobium algorifonticola TaxID=2008318 RepID=A0A437J7H7_9SPHN|nr:DUF3445 domain-containing protein [Sphingobium algorifonticola]RVT41120.1 DUF3445 domain-containing protein [Sphingobium algorifonticola]